MFSVTIFITLISTSIATEVWDLGCYSDNRGNREFKVSAGNYKTSDSTPQQCTSACAHGNLYKYAATEGSRCFCSNSMISVTKVNDDKCTSVCTSGICDGNVYIRVFNTNLSIAELTVEAPAFGFLLEDVTLTASVAKGKVNSSYVFDYGDKSYALSTCCNTTHKYTQTGSFHVRVSAKNSQSGPIHSSKWIHIESKLGLVSIKCPTMIIPSGKKTTVMATTSQGSRLRGKFITTQEPTSSFFNASDALMAEIGSKASFGNISGSPQSDGAYIKPTAMFTQAGRIKAWELYSSKVGPIRLQVYRPVCESLQVFCPSTRTCIASNSTCQSAMQFKCPSNGSVCMYTGKCFQGCSINEAAYSKSALPLVNYKLISDAIVNVSKVGHNLFTLTPSQSVGVEAGDVIGWSANSSAGDLAFENSADPEYFYPHSSFDITAGSTLKNVSPATRFDISHVVKAHLSQSSCASKDFVFDKGDVYRVSIEIENILPTHSNKKMDSCMVYVQDNITGLEVQTPLCYDQNVSYALGENITFKASIKSGTNASFIWFAAGEVLYGETVTKTISEVGLHNAMVTAVNNISAGSSSIMFSVQKPPGIITLYSSPFMEVDIPSNFSIAVAGGTNLTQAVYIDNELVLSVFYLEANNTFYNFSHIFSVGGQKTVKIVASNNINGRSQIKSVKIYVKGKIGDIMTEVRPQLTCSGVLEISTGEFYEISIYSTLNIPINYTMNDGVSSDIKRKTTLEGKATFSGTYNEDFGGNIVINASANGDIVKTLIPVKASKCGPYSIIKPLQYERSSPFIITKAKALEIKYDSKLTKKRDECDYGTLTYKWGVFDLKSYSAVNVGSVEFDKPTLLIPPLKLEEGNYTVNMSLTYKTQAAQLCYKYETFIDVRQSNLFCVIQGGTRRGVAYDNGVKIVLDGGRSVDPDQPSESKLTYQWRCKRKQDNETNEVFKKPWNQNAVPFCNSTTFTILPKSRNGEIDWKRLPAIEHFLETATYEFEQTIRHNEDNRQRTCNQIITILPAEQPSMSIKCNSNCKDKVNPFDRLILSASCSNCKVTYDLQYSWTIFDNNMNLDNLMSEPSKSTSTGFNKMSLVIVENILKERSKYKVKLEVTRRTQSVFVTYEFETTSKPRGGSCKAIPDKGYTVKDKFKVSCDRWFTEDSPITYKFLYKSTVDEEAQITSLPDHSTSTILMYFGDERETPLMALPTGIKQEDYRLLLSVKISNRFDAFSLFYVNVTVRPLTSLDTKESIDDVSNQLQQGKASNLDPKENPQGVLSFVITSSALLNSANAKTEVSNEKSKDIRGKMVEMAAAIEVDSLPIVIEQCHAFSGAIQNKNDVSNDVQITASSALKKSSELLLSKANEKGYDKKSPTQIEEVAQAVFSVTAKTIDASETTTQDFLKLVVENLNKKPDEPKSRAWRERIRERDSEDSAEAAENVMADLNAVINMAATAIQKNKVEDEKETFVKTKKFGMQLSKTTFSKMRNESLKVYGSNEDPIGSFELPQNTDFLNGVHDVNETVSSQVVRFNDNPVRWDKENSAFMQTSIIGLELRDKNDKEIPVKDLTEPIVIWVPTSNSTAVESSKSFDSTTFLTSHYQVKNPAAAQEPVLIHVNPNRLLTMYVRFDGYPSPTLYDLVLELPNANQSLPWPFTYVDQYTILVHDLYLRGQHVYLGLKSTELKSQVLNKPGNVGSSEVRQYLLINYTMDVRSVGCRHWSEKNTASWSGSGCKVGNKTAYQSVQCLCNHLTFFGGLSIKPNPISPPTLDKFTRGYACLIAVCVIFILYFIALIWARRKDRADAIKVGACPLPDNDPTDEFRYEVTLWTSMRRGAGTTSKVNIILCGEEHDSEPRALEDPERKPFQRGSVDTFLLTTPYILGSLPYIRIWHDNSGGSWFLSRVMIVDLQTDEHHYFICNRWLAVDEDDGQVERLIPLASKEELTEFQHLFVARTRRNLSDSHLWFSVFARPASSRFTRVQRLTCCLCLMMMAMMTSCMYYGVAAQDKSSQSFGGFVFTWSEVAIGIISSLIVFPVNLIVVQIFRSVRPKPHRITHRKLPMPPKLSLTVNNLTSYNRMTDDDSNKGSNNSIDSTQEKNNAKMRLSINDVHTDVDRISFTSSPLLVDRRRSTVWETQASNRFGRIVQWFKRYSSLPYYFVYLAWTLSFILTIGAAIVIILYGIDFGNEKSLKWLFASSVSFVQDVIITQPLKVLGSAIFFALVVKKPDQGEFEVTSDTAQLAEDEDWAYNVPGDKKTKKRVKTKLLPPDEAKLLAMRNARLKERKMYSVIREVGSFYIFLCLVMMIAYTHKDFNSFVQTDVTKKMFVNDFLEIKKDLDFWVWAREHLMTNLFPSKWYNGKKIESNGFLSDKSSQMVGGARLRHIRIKDEVCSVPPSTTFIHRECFGEYAMSDEEKQDYLVSWINVTKYSKPVSRKDVSWRYQSWTELDGYPVWALLNTYSGGGYVLVLEPGMKNMDNLKKLEKQFWIDRHTRAIITEFTTYNAQTDLFTINTLVAEFPASGGVIPYVNIHTARLYNYTSSYMTFVLACECIFVLFILFFLYRELRKLFREGTPHFKQFWNICEIVIVVSAGVGIGLNIYRYLKFRNVLEETRKAPFQFKSFQLAAYWDETYTLTIAILVTFATIKLNKLLRFNKRMSILSSTLKNAAFSLAMFGLIFGILFLAFSLIGTVVFGTQVNEYRNTASSFTSLLSLMLGKTTFKDLDEANRILGPLFFFAFMFLVSMVLINMFLSIIIDSYHEVKRDLEKQDNEYEIVDFIIERFKLWSGIGKVPVKPQFRHRHVKWDAVQAKVKTVYAFKHSRDDCVTELEDRLEKLLQRTNQLYTEVFPEKFRKAGKRLSYSSTTKPDHRL